MEKLNFWELEIDGVDRTGKDTLCNYIAIMTNYKYSINVRGIISQLAYNKIYNRNYEYSFKNISNKKILIYLYANVEDLKIRAKLTNEPMINFEEEIKAFDYAINDLEKQNFEILVYNTSKCTPYEIALSVINKINELEEYTR